MRNILNVIADILTLVAVCVAAIGHVLPWFDSARMGLPPDMGRRLIELQMVQAARSGTALAVLAGLIFLSLLIRWGPGLRRLLNIAMFMSAFAALLFELLIFSSLPHREGWHPVQLGETEPGFAVAMIATCFAIFFCLLRMLWTMPPTRPPRLAELDKTPPLAFPPKESEITERKPWPIRLVK
jgi:hypothetical protein